MQYLSRVVWSEGMYLGPHHFQVQSRYFEDSIRFATASLWFEAWGLIGLNLDEEALLNGTLSVVHARGILPDGLAFNMPESDPLPEARAIAEIFPPHREKLTAYLAIPKRRQNGLNCVEANGTMPADVRFIAESNLLHDETTGMDEKPVRLGRKNLRLILETESPEDYIAMPIARIMRDFNGRYVFDHSFIPPSAQIVASERLMTMLSRLVDILEDKSTSLSRVGKGERSWAEFSTRDIANFWFLHTVNSALAPLRNFLIAKRGHPEELFREMSRLGGALCTFSLDTHPRDLPLYDHRRLDECFGMLDDMIRKLLETIAPSNFISIPLTYTGNYIWEGEVRDTRVLGSSRWILAIASEGVGEVDLISQTPDLVKICSREFVPELVKRALRGMGLVHLPIPPAAIPARVDTQYFLVGRGGTQSKTRDVERGCWEHITKTKQIGVYVPGEIPDPKLELLVIVDA
jgi:type VI secretion system protein ImpJ